MLRILFIAFSLMFIGHSYGRDCERSGELVRGIGPVEVKGIIKCGGKPLYGAYVQLVDDFQAVNDVVGHGHTDHDGSFKLTGQYYFYSDTDLAPARGSWQVVVYSYCGLGNNRKNQCHRVHKTRVYFPDSGDNDKGACLEIDADKSRHITTGIKVAKTITIENDMKHPTEKLIIDLSTSNTPAVKEENICLDGSH